MGMQVAVHAQHRRQADGEMDVGAALLGAQLEECVDARHGATLSHCKRWFSRSEAL